jgi:hypothetical protein
MVAVLNKARVIAFYLPQFHPVPENNEWWGPGFTEWTNVGRASKLFRNHYQPRVPADLGYYDLRLASVIQAQADMAKFAGVEGFAFWHYWWAGKKLLEKPLNILLENPQIDLPFSLAWANETWSGVWHGSPNKILVEQTYPGEDDHIAHFYDCLPAFKDPRYITVNGKLLFFLYRPMSLPSVEKFINLWNKLAHKEGVQGFYFVGASGLAEKEYSSLIEKGFSAVNSFRMMEACQKDSGVISLRISKVLEKFGFVRPRVHSYRAIIKYMFNHFDSYEGVIPTILPQWDNSPRSRLNSLILTGSTPEEFRTHVSQELTLLSSRREQEKLVYLKSWNEWAEGNYVEPDLKYGWGYLKVLRELLLGLPSADTDPTARITN